MDGLVQSLTQDGESKSMFGQKRRRTNENKNKQDVQIVYRSALAKAATCHAYRRVSGRSKPSARSHSDLEWVHFTRGLISSSEAIPSVPQVNG